MSCEQADWNDHLILKYLWKRIFHHLSDTDAEYLKMTQSLIFAETRGGIFNA